MFGSGSITIQGKTPLNREYKYEGAYVKVYGNTKGADIKIKDGPTVKLRPESQRRPFKKNECKSFLERFVADIEGWQEEHLQQRLLGTEGIVHSYTGPSPGGKPTDEIRALASKFAFERINHVRDEETSSEEISHLDLNSALPANSVAA